MRRDSWIALAVLVADQASKGWAQAALAGKGPVAVLPFFNLTLVYNTGAAFGLLRDAGGWQNGFFILVAVAVTVFVLVVVRRLGAADRQLGVALMLVLGGALGNLVDRLLRGHVVDFLDFYYGDWHWPAFNLADAAISIGALLLVLDALGWRLIRPGCAS